MFNLRNSYKMLRDIEMLHALETRTNQTHKKQNQQKI